ncbi:Response regulator receiver domain-containing protein [Desulfacinum hydrothermale DSM 13146]|uniref:Response regulator receiver domain-containing protein n=1 Tax=Desulfacinum hydrothermale DSM 13146 TaxID=1121390 RepID=A0A1W1XQI3_9BACT|nr:response regulator [Desulfacinum hydrothermale]SMC26250.1 Response regulator receiver domain-containing protein [Desulfacinum hydrothermale DSM 13146]
MKRILVIEDDEGLRDLLQNFLEETGYQVVQAADGLEGMEAIEKESFDLIVVDVMLPYVSGIGLLKIVKKRNPDLPIICITGYGNSPEELAQREHADRVLSKPFDLKNLLGAVQELLAADEPESP